MILYIQKRICLLIDPLVMERIIMLLTFHNMTKTYLQDCLISPLQDLPSKLLAQKLQFR